MSIQCPDQKGANPGNCLMDEGLFDLDNCKYTLNDLLFAILTVLKELIINFKVNDSIKIIYYEKHAHPDGDTCYYYWFLQRV